MENTDLLPTFEELQQKYAALLYQHEELRHVLGGPDVELKLAIFHQFPMPVWACDRNCRIVFWNDAAARVYGFPVEEAIGQDFVDLFVNVPEREKARIDCMDIIDNNRPIRNMANDIDKHGNTRTLVTQCFAVYNIQEHPGLQVEVSYEVQDIERLQRELEDLQEEHRRAEQDREELRRKLVDVTRARALKALEWVVESVKGANRTRRKTIQEAELKKDADQQMLAKAKAEVKTESERLVRWERDIRNQLMSLTSAEELEALIEVIEGSETFDV